MLRSGAWNGRWRVVLRFPSGRGQEAMSMPIRIEKASAADIDDVLLLLGAHHLPLDGLLDHAATTLVARDGEAVVGSAALEIPADGALLRSVAVAPSQQGKGVGQALTREALALARERRVLAVYLLTTTADGFFPKFGFERVSRDDVPAAVRASVEFTSACPASAVVMRKHLGE
jgi:amino-acid N-acetyltransferase